jgi:hypothetical protein
MEENKKCSDGRIAEDERLLTEVIDDCCGGKDDMGGSAKKGGVARLPKIPYVYVIDTKSQSEPPRCFWENPDMDIPF